MPPLVARASASHLRIARAQQWLAARSPGQEVLVVAPSLDAANDLLRHATAGLARGASFGWHRATLGRLAASLAAPLLAERDLAPVGVLACEAVVARAVQRLRTAGELGRHAAVSEGPGFARAAAATLAEIRLARVPIDELRAIAPELARLRVAFETELAEAGLADRAQVFELAEQAGSKQAATFPLLGLATLFFDVAPSCLAEARLFSLIANRSREWMGTLAAGDEASLSLLDEDLTHQIENLDESPVRGTSLQHLQRNLFGDGAPELAELGDDVVVLSAPGEGRECVEIARRLLRFAAAGVPFDRMAVLLRSVDEYRPHLEEALGRAEIPAHFARGAVRPDPAGRALLALLHCARERLSASRFAEYLSLGELPDAAEFGDPPAALAAADRWVPPDHELAPERIADALLALVSEASDVAETDAELDPETRSVTLGTLRAPRSWEKLLVESSVIGGLDRWQRRLDGLEHQRTRELAGLDDPDDPRRDRIRRDIELLASLRNYAIPMLAELEALPREANWGEWLDAIARLATRAIRHSERVLSVLAELAPMAEVGPVGFDEVMLVLSRRLHSLTVAAADARYGKVFVAPATGVRGLSFEVVLVPGLAEKLFPRKISEDPILLDAQRAQLGVKLANNEDRVAFERQALRLAVGAATRRVVLSYPRLDLEQSRPRVPSFYLLEAMRSAEGRLPGFDELASRAETHASVRIGWPAPEHPEDAIDEAEHDLALLERLRDRNPEESVGTARYLLSANPHLGRALRFRARRWLRRWTPADGLVDPSPAARDAVAKHSLSARSYSPTALQNYAVCPYKFFLYALLRLTPREEPEAIEELDPLQRGSLVHDIQFEFFSRMRDAGLLPVRKSSVGDALARLDEVIDDVARRHRDELAPAIERVWDDGVAWVRADLREWLARAARDDSGFEPWRFELSFGLPGDRARDPNSRDEAVHLDCGIALRGSIDLVELDSKRNCLRVTDHKTGKARVGAGELIAGGTSLQPVFYALAMEKLASEQTVESGRLYYCTSAGGFHERDVALDDAARRSAVQVAQVVGGSIDAAFLPAQPAKGACRFCDFAVVCGPYEELRTARKPAAGLEGLQRLRKLP